MLHLLERVRGSEHKFCRDNLSGYIDGQLSPHVHERVQQHLAQCEACRSDLAALQRTVALLHELPRVKAPRSFRIPQSLPAPSVPFWMRPGAYAALRTATAAAAVLFLIAVAGNALAGPAFTASAPAPAAAFGSADVTTAAQAPMATPGPERRGVLPIGTPTTSAAQGEALPNDTPAAPAAQSVGPLPNDTPAAPMPGANAPAPAPASLVPPTAWGKGADAANQPTLTAEEATRRASAPPGKGADAATPQPTELPECTPDGRGLLPPALIATPPAPDAGLPAPSATPAPAAAALGASPLPTEAALAQGAPSPAAEATQAKAAAAGADAYALAEPAAPNALQGVRQQLSGYPWQPLMIAMAAVLALLVGATFWLRAARTHWP